MQPKALACRYRTHIVYPIVHAKIRVPLNSVKASGNKLRGPDCSGVGISTCGGLDTVILFVTAKYLRRGSATEENIRVRDLSKLSK